MRSNPMLKNVIKKLNRSDGLVLLALVLALGITYWPLIQNITTKTFGNDMGSNWVYADYMRRSVAQFGQYSLWFTGFLSGFPLASSNLAGIFYPPHLLFLIIPLKLAFNLLTLTHVLFSGLAAFIFARVILRQSSFPSFVGALSLMLSPKIMNHNNLGHFNLIESIPLVIFALFFLILATRRRSYYLAAIAGLFLGLIITVFSIFYVYALFAISSYILVVLVRINIPKRNLKDSFLLIAYPMLAVITSLLVSAVFLFPFVEFSQLSLRGRLGFWEGAFPSIYRESLLQLFYILPDRVHNGETLLYVGIPTLLLAFIGIATNYKNKYVWMFVTLALFALSVSFGANEIFYKIYYRILPIFHFMRAPVRIWILVIISLTMLSTLGVSYLLSRFAKYRFILSFLTVVLVFGSLYIYNKDYFYLVDYDKKDISLLKDLDKDNRIYCLDNCLAVPEAIPEEYQFSNGGEVVMLQDYYEFMQKAAGYHFDGYSISVPPYQIFGEGDYHQEQHLDPALLGLINTKYVISRSRLENPDIRLMKQENGYFIYENLKVLPRAYTTSSLSEGDVVERTINFYSPNKINLGFENRENEYLILSDLFYPGWKAYDNDQEVSIEKAHNILRAIKLAPGNHTIRFEYFPDSLKFGIVITALSLLSLTLYPFLAKKKSAKNN